MATSKYRIDPIGSDPPAAGSPADFSAVGIVIPAEWNENGDPVLAALSTYGEEIYIIDRCNDAGENLHGLMHKKVRVSGVVYSLADGRKAIRVKRFKVREPVRPRKP